MLWRQFGAEDPALDNVWLLCRTVGGISLNWPKSCDPARDELLLQAQASTDPAERVELYKQIEQMIHDQYLYIFLAHTTVVERVRRGRARRLRPRVARGRAAALRVATAATGSRPSGSSE